MLAGLQAATHQERLRAVDALRTLAQQQPAHTPASSASGSSTSTAGSSGLPGVPEADLARALAGALLDGNWNVRREALALVAELVPRGAATTVSVAAALVANLGDAKVTIRKAAAAALLAWMRACASPQTAVDLLVASGLRAPDDRVQLETVQFLRSASVCQQSRGTRDKEEREKTHEEA